MLSFWDFVEMAEKGKIMGEKDFDSLLSKTLRELEQKYEIKYNPENPVSSDDNLSDRLFDAAVEFFEKVGVYVIDTGRQVTLSKDDLYSILESAPSEVVYGSGNETVKVSHRKVEDEVPPVVFFSAVGTPVREELFVELCMSYAKEQLADTFSGPLITEYRGRPIASGSPVEVEAAIWNVMKLREAARFSGRPYMPIHNFISVAEKTDATVAGAREEFGAFPGDGLFTAAIAEMKVDYERLKRTTFLMHTPYVRGGLYGPLLGGYAGGPGGTAIALVAHHFLGLCFFQAQRHNAFPIHINYVCNTDRMLLWLLSVSGQALARNTHLVTASNAFMASGPCTEMVIYELAAHSITSTVSGWHLNPAAVAKNRHPEHATGMEARIHAEVGHATAGSGITRQEANFIVDKLLEKYENRLSKPPIGKSFTECYDIKRIKPKDDYLKLWDEKKKELETLGLSFRNIPHRS